MREREERNPLSRDLLLVSKEISIQSTYIYVVLEGGKVSLPEECNQVGGTKA